MIDPIDVDDMTTERLTFELADKSHAKAIEQMRRLCAMDLTERLGAGHWSGFSRLQSIRERIATADPERLRRMTLYIVCVAGAPIASIAVTSFPPGFWRRSYWQEPNAAALGAFNLAVLPEFQRQGVGSFVMRGVERLARECEYDFVRLDAYSENPISTRFYRSLGYEERRQIEVRWVGLTLFEKEVRAASFKETMSRGACGGTHADG